MSTEDNKATVRRFRDALNAGDVGAAMSVFAQDAVIHLSGAPGPLNPEAFKQFGGAFLAAFPDGEATVEDVIAEGDKVVSRLTFRGTHTADLMGMPPTGQTVAVSELTIDRIADGRIVESWRLFDQAAMMRQLGAVEEPEEA